MSKKTVLNLLACISGDEKGENLPLDDSIENLKGLYKELVVDELAKQKSRTDLNGFPFDPATTFFVCDRLSKHPFSVTDIDILLETKLNPYNDRKFSEEGLSNLIEIKTFFRGSFGEWGGLLEILESLEDNKYLGREDISLLREKILEIENTKTTQELCNVMKFFGENDELYLKYLNSPVLDDLYLWCTGKKSVKTVKAVELLLKRGWKIGLKKAVRKGYTPVVSVLIDKFSKEKRAEKIKTALYIASENGNTEIIKLLLNRGADIHTENDFVLRIASAVDGNTEAVRLLLDRGADVHSSEALIQAAIGNSDNQDANIETVRLLLDRGADIHADEDDALIQASGNGHKEIVRLLLDRGANIHARDDQAINMADLFGDEETVQLLLDRGARGFDDTFSDT